MNTFTWSQPNNTLENNCWTGLSRINYTDSLKIFLRRGLTKISNTFHREDFPLLDFLLCAFFNCYYLANTMLIGYCINMSSLFTSLFILVSPKHLHHTTKRAWQRYICEPDSNWSSHPRENFKNYNKEGLHFLKTSDCDKLRATRDSPSWQAEVLRAAWPSFDLSDQRDQLWGGGIWYLGALGKEK